jgi:hypothetical protein
VQTGAAVGPGLGALVYAGLYAVPPEAIAWRALFAGADLAFPETRGERRGAGSAAFVCGTLLSGQAIARFGIAVAVWLNAGLRAATALAARLVPDRHRRVADEIRPQRPPLGDRRFADSSLEGDGSELPVPVRQAKLTRFCR